MLRIKIIASDKTEFTYSKEFGASVNKNLILKYIEHYMDEINRAYGLGIVTYYLLVEVIDNIDNNNNSLLSTTLNNHYIEVRLENKLKKE